MASIARDPNGRRRILFIGADDKRRTIRLGKTTQRAAETVAIRVDSLNAAQVSRTGIDRETAEWVAHLSPVLYDKLAAVGLVPKRGDTRLGPFLTVYVAGRQDVKPLTRQHLERAQRLLVEFFGVDQPLAATTAGDADRFRLWLLAKESGKGMCDNTARRICGRAKQFFKAAQRAELIRRNPFADIATAVKGNASRFYFVTEEESQRVLACCPDAQWRLLFALSRYGALRCPSEHLALKWGDVDWERNRIRVTSPKTAHHEGRESRLIPLFPELRTHLEAVWEQTTPGTEFVITRYRHANANLRTQLERIIGKSGLSAWPKLFQNLRSTRETELAERFPIHVVCAWVGNTQAVAAKHYLQVREQDFDRAAAADPQPSETGIEKAAQNPAQQPSEMPSFAPQGVLAMGEFAEENSSLRPIAEWQAPRLGLEPRT